MNRSITQFDVSDERKLRSSLNGLQEKVFDSIFNGFLGAGEFIDASGSTDFTLVGGKALALRFPSGIDNSAEANVRIDPNWINGNLYVKLLYSGSVTTNDYNVRVSITPIAIGSSVTASSTDVTKSISPPGTENFLLSETFNPFPMGANSNIFTISIKRRGAAEAPANTGHFYLFAIGWRYYAERI